MVYYTRAQPLSDFVGLHSNRSLLMEASEVVFVKCFATGDHGIQQDRDVFNHLFKFSFLLNLFEPLVYPSPCSMDYASLGLQVEGRFKL